MNKERRIQKALGTAQRRCVTLYHVPMKYRDSLISIVNEAVEFWLGVEPRQRVYDTAGNVTVDLYFPSGLLFSSSKATAEWIAKKAQERHPEWIKSLVFHRMPDGNAHNIYVGPSRSWYFQVRITEA